jgi:hypothetical protein
VVSARGYQHSYTHLSKLVGHDLELSLHIGLVGTYPNHQPGRKRWQSSASVSPARTKPLEHFRRLLECFLTEEPIGVRPKCHHVIVVRNVPEFATGLPYRRYNGSLIQSVTSVMESNSVPVGRRRSVEPARLGISLTFHHRLSSPCSNKPAMGGARSRTPRSAIHSPVSKKFSDLLPIVPKLIPIAGPSRIDADDHVSAA